ncbi:MAG: hypothetical protein J5717_13130 [Lachnospiraceae bacterium]|nr:hypothetical protein [Lachnospiraceae bacterium]
MKRTIKTKKIAAIIFATMMALSAVACGDKTGANGGETTVSSSDSKQEKDGNVTSEEKDEKAGSNNSHDWPYMEEGTYGKYVVETYGKCEDLTSWGNYKDFQLTSERLYIKFPSLIPTSDNRFAYQSDDTEVLVGDVARSDFENQITDVKSILELSAANYEDHRSAPHQMVRYWKLTGKGDVKMEITSSELETVGQYECCKYIGMATSTRNRTGETHSYQFVAYSTFTKLYNEPIYWIVFDKSEDQSLGDTIADYAKKMGYTIVEEDLK